MLAAAHVKGWTFQGFAGLLCDRQASRKAGKFSEDGTFDDKKTSQLPMFEKAILTAAQRFLEEWKDQSLASVSTLVAMEQDFVTAAFFRHAIAQRSLAMQQQDQMHDIFDSKPSFLVPCSMPSMYPSIRDGKNMDRARRRLTKFRCMATFGSQVDFRLSVEICLHI